ncbi:MAG TPA: hypothetical protein VFW23_01655, partial [Tepidisphaeraceae bacterium]|nr:hypothetical protein [Tepidisphaeraceae bacterium]
MFSSSSTYSSPTKRVPIYGWLLLLALAAHAPLLLFQLQAGSFDANTHMFFADHYAHHWFNPWNEKWFAGFSQTTYPPLVHQLIALFSHIVGLTMAYTIVQGMVILLLPIGVYRYARLWVNERAALYAAIGSIFLGSLTQMVYQSGQINTTFASVMLLNSLPFFYRWIREGSMLAFWKGLAIFLVGAAGHHVSMIFATPFFALPIIWLAFVDHRDDRADAAAGAVVMRTIIFAVLAIVGVLVVLAPYWVELYHNPIKQAPIYHESRANYILEPMQGMNFWLIPTGALILVIPFIFWRGATDRRLRPLFLGWWFTAIIGLGGTTPLPKLLFGRIWEVLTYERFTYWATLMALPFAGLIADWLIERFRGKAMAGLALASVLSGAGALAWLHANPIQSNNFSIDDVVSFLNRDDHAKYRYITLGFGMQLARVGVLANASSVDGDYNSARLLPELMEGGSAQLTNAKYFGANGIDSLRAMLKHADHYGLKYIFIRDRYYEPLVAFAGWREAEVYDNGNVTLWTKEDVPPAHKITPPPGAVPTAFESLLWGTLPLCTVIFALALLIIFPERRRIAETIDVPATETPEPVALREA